MASKRRNMFYKNKKQETTDIVSLSETSYSLKAPNSKFKERDDILRYTSQGSPRHDFTTGNPVCSPQRILRKGLQEEDVLQDRQNVISFCNSSQSDIILWIFLTRRLGRESAVLTVVIHVFDPEREEEPLVVVPDDLCDELLWWRGVHGPHGSRREVTRVSPSCLLSLGGRGSWHDVRLAVSTDWPLASPRLTSATRFVCSLPLRPSVYLPIEEKLPLSLLR
ncbi:hypothetical protein AAG570_001372 [Ranatra chinensis]|uniref:Uncharacterized protein n=1 Tax=Ranatra chinensis TaxID=642074 RepID=A0ABD0YBQ0_9HEMI